ncbi:hypothetical protein [Allomuricauda sp. ARW1Y1]|jgi:hypothetical protein|uniref:hypothetical protein n=1 Tax=Allomuricauda sp. ARW1Y1 TaxID=2663843 RepID=UPI0015CC8856|nr:hypothetical protein [Muricauda sp. ARW1Y1]NYJ29060.1 hypothetical protein [Muricauda sp. ARW1Y1]
MGNIENKNIIQQEFEDDILLSESSKEFKRIRAKADSIYNKKINTQRNYAKKQIVLFKKRIFILKEKTKFRLKRFYRLYSR